jgi:hypothetical protein
VIEHAKGLLLFDTGQDRASVIDDAYFPGGLTGLLYDRLARFHIGEEETLAARLATLGYAPADVDTAILLACRSTWRTVQSAVSISSSPDGISRWWPLADPS